jgi:hypothetical protein
VRLAALAAGQGLVLATLSVTAWAAGRGALRAMRLDPDAVPVSLALTAGLMVLSQGALLLGLFGLLRAPVIAAGILAGCAAAAWTLRRWRSLGARAGRERKPLPAARIGLACALVALALPGAALTLYPPLGFDQVMYHLPMARAFAASGGVPFLPALRYPIFPPLGEVLNAAVLTLAGDVATQATGWLALVIALAVVYTWTRERSTPAGGWLAVGVLAGSPLAWYLASTGYVEPLLALFGAAACYAADRARRDGAVGWLVLAGALAGSAAGVKYLGLYLVPAVAIVAAARAPWPVAARRAAVVVLAAVAALAPSYGRLIAHTGNPLFPFYPALFGASPWAAQDFLGHRGTARLAAAATALWDAAFRPERIGGLPVLSSAVALGVPLVAWSLWRRPPVAIAAGVTVGFLALAPVHAHYLLAIVPVWSVAIGLAAAGLAGTSRLGRVAMIGATIVLVAAGESFVVSRLRALGPPPTTAEARDRLLTAQRPLYPAIQFLNREAPGEPVYGVEAENMVDDRVGPLLGDHNGPFSYRRIEARLTALGTASAVLDEIPVRYLLVRADAATATRWVQADPRMQRIYADAHATVYRVSPAAPAARDTGAPPRPD